ncbi:MAG: hypothetical protein Q8Q85_02650 [Gemmatimonadales bacterium]|nr:hypothetical protein [Gemmatimonadales bacterium]
MKVWGPKLVTTGFALAGVLSLVAGGVKPAIKGEPLNVTFLGVGVFWLVLSVVVGRKSGSGPAPPSA